MSSSQLPLEELLQVQAPTRKVIVGLPKPVSINDHRFPLTPEGAALLVERGFCVKIEREAADRIHYSDQAYARFGIEITERAETLEADIIICLAPLSQSDARRVKRGALLLSFLNNITDNDRESLRILMRRHVIALALEKLTDGRGNRPFADILREIDGRAAIAIASSLLADAVHGKGILLGGVAGIIPCEVMIIGADTAATAAAKSAIGLGAQVKMFAADTAALRQALDAAGPGAVGSVIHPKVFESALRSADIVIATDTDGKRGIINYDLVATMKRGVICFDLTHGPVSAFPSMQTIDLDLASPWDNDSGEPVRLCYVNAGNAVPRTVAMALSNTFAAALDELIVCDGVVNALSLNEGLRNAAFLFLGKCVNREVAAALGERWVDINLFLQLS